jgi:hypothetical protein
MQQYQFFIDLQDQLNMFWASFSPSSGKKSQSCAPEDGQKLARNMLS